MINAVDAFLLRNCFELDRALMGVKTVGKGIAVEDEISGLLTDSEYAAMDSKVAMLCRPSSWIFG